MVNSISSRYGFALAAHILKQHKTTCSGPLIIYEVGAGNGTLMENILDYIYKESPEVYSTMKYTIIEISTLLARIQDRKRQKSRHINHIEIVNKSIFKYGLLSLIPDAVEDKPCFFVAMEVLDNLSHDIIRYDIDTGIPYQAITLVDHIGEFKEGYEILSDPLIKRYLDTREKTGYIPPHLQKSVLNNIKKLSPFRSDLTDPEFLPTMAFSLMEKINTHFPNHHLLVSDFSSLPDTIPGTDSPVVQTRYEDTM
jgi:Putative S-adenosyl-L-methionine-dependent methyltransferase